MHIQIWDQGYQSMYFSSLWFCLLCPQMTGTTQQNSKAQQVHITASSAAGNTPVSVTLDPQAQLESDKRAVYR